MAEERLHDRIAARMATLEEKGLIRTLRAPSGIDLCSTDYLALAAHPAITARMIAAITEEGCGSTGSRLLRGHRDGFAAVERRFASFKQTAAALYFSSGYLANLAVLTTFPETGDVVFSDERNHASLIDGVRLSRGQRVIFPHNDVSALARLLREPRNGHAFVVCESLFSMDGDTAPLQEYAALCRVHNASLIVDEAHAVGVYGRRGSGLIESTGIAADVCVTINTAGKALGVSGAFVAGGETEIAYLMQRARPFVFSTAPPPAVAAALDASLAIVAAEPDRRERLLRLARYCRGRLADAGLSVPPGDSQIIPVVIGENDRTVAVARTLQDQGFDVRAIRPPSVPAGTARLRIAINAGLDEATIDGFARALAQALAGNEKCPFAVFS